MPRATVADVRSTLAAVLRADLKRAAGPDKQVQPAERAAVLPYSADVAAALGGTPTVDDVMDEAMGRATRAWDAVNQASGPGKVWLSQAEIRALRASDPALADVTGAAAAIVLRRGGASSSAGPLRVTLDAPAGIAMGVSGVRVLDVGLSAGPTVPVGTSFAIVVDGHRLELQRGRAGLTVDSLVAPKAYGLEVIERSAMAEPTATARLKITRDPRSWPAEEALVVEARAGLEAHIREVRMHDADWGAYFPSTWSELQARGVPAALDAFFTDAETLILRTQHKLTFVGRGPFGLYTEVTLDKATGTLDRAFVEID